MIHCLFENNKKRFLRHITLGAIVVRNGKILLEKRGPKLINPNKYCIPGGFLERGETLAQGVLRELREETGYAGEIDYLLCINDSPYRPHEDRQNVDVIFVVNVLKKVGGRDGEAQEVKWFNLNDLPAEDEFAFDHFEDIRLYLQYRENPSAFKIPIIKF